MDFFSKKITNEIGYQVYDLNLKKNILFGLLNFIILIKKNRYTHAQGWMYHGNLLSALAKVVRPNIEVFWNIRQTLYDIKKEKLTTRLIILFNKILSKIPKKIFINSEVSKLQHLEFGFCNNFKLVSNIIFDNEFYFNENFCNEFKKEFDLKENYFCIGLFQRNHPMKNINLFINACLDILQEYNNLKFFIFGKDTLKLKNLINTRYQEDFIFEENYQNLNKAINGMNLIVNTSSWGEGLSNNLIEAYFCKTRFITSDVGDNKNFAQLTNNDFFQKNNIKELKFQITKHIKKFKEKGVKSYNLTDKKILGRFDSKKILENYIEEYKH